MTRPLSVAVMAHPKRRRLVPGLELEIGGSVETVWDRRNDRWDTGRRAMLAFDPNSEWHVVVQDDAIVCNDFRAGVASALEHVPDGSPASFYTGRCRPHGPAVASAVNRAVVRGRSWLAMRGPLWGPAVAVQTSVIPDMIKRCDELDIENYDLRMAAYFAERDTDCWYSIPSLVEHRVGAKNPSLVPGRSSSASRTAHMWIGRQAATDVDWGRGALHAGPLDDMWHAGPVGFQCTRCGSISKELAGAIAHADTHERLGRVDMLGTDADSLDKLSAVRDALPERLVGRLWAVSADPCKDPGAHDSSSAWLSSLVAAKVLKESSGLMLVGTEQDLQHVGSRPAVTLYEELKVAQLGAKLAGARIAMRSSDLLDRSASATSTV